MPALEQILEELKKEHPNQDQILEIINEAKRENSDFLSQTINLGDGTTATALGLAAFKGHVEVVKTLLESENYLTSPQNFFTS